MAGRSRLSRSRMSQGIDDRSDSKESEGAQTSDDCDVGPGGEGGMI